MKYPHSQAALFIEVLQYFPKVGQPATQILFQGVGEIEQAFLARQEHSHLGLDENELAAMAGTGPPLERIEAPQIFPKVQFVEGRAALGLQGQPEPFRATGQSLMRRSDCTSWARFCKTCTWAWAVSMIWRPRSR